MNDAHDRVLDWHEELRRIAPRLLELPIAARLAIYDTVEQFLQEDAAQPARQRLSIAA